MYDNRHHLILGFHGCDEETFRYKTQKPYPDLRS